jgi:hypothetical protein
MIIINFYITPVMAEHIYSDLKHVKGSDDLRWDEECLDHVTLFQTKPKSEQPQKIIKEWKRITGIDTPEYKEAAEILLNMLRNLHTFMKSCNFKTTALLGRNIENQTGTLCLANLFNNTLLPKESVMEYVKIVINKYEMCFQSPKEDRFHLNPELSETVPLVFSVAIPALDYAKSIIKSQTSRTIKKGEFIDGLMDLYTTNPIELRSMTYEKSNSDVKLTCTYTSNQGSEKHVWRFGDALYMDGKKVKHLGWSVTKKEGKNLFIVKGMANLAVWIEFIINFEKTDSVITASGVRVQGECV